MNFFYFGPSPLLHRLCLRRLSSSRGLCSIFSIPQSHVTDKKTTGSELVTSLSIPPTRPDMNSLFKLRLFPLSLERSALLAQFEAEERYAIECAQIAYDEERERVEEEWKRGRQRVRERLLEGIEERRRRAREEKEGEGTVGG